MSHHAIVQEFEQWVSSSPTRTHEFSTAVSTARASNTREIADIETLPDYYTFLDSLVNWIPVDGVEGKDIFIRIARMHFILDQPSVEKYQSPILPQVEEGSPRLTWLSDWIVRYGKEIGAWMDRPGPITKIQYG